MAVDATTNTIVPNDAIEKSHPDCSWELDKLEQYARAELFQADSLDTEAIQLGRQSTGHLFRAGHALFLIRERKKADGTGVQWQETSGLSRTTVWEAIKLYSTAKTEEAVTNLTRTEAKVKFKVVPQRGAENPKSRNASNQHTQNAHVQNSEEVNDEEQGGGDNDASNLEDAADQDLKQQQEELRQITPHAAAVAILNALEDFVDDLTANGGPDAELANVCTQIADMAEAAKLITGGDDE